MVVAKAQNETGKIPGIVPTGGWGYGWGNGPAWDVVMPEGVEMSKKGVEF